MKLTLSLLLALALMTELSQALFCGLFSRWKPWCRQNTPRPRPININVPISGNDNQPERCEAITCYYVASEDSTEKNWNDNVTEKNSFESKICDLPGTGSCSGATKTKVAEACWDGHRSLNEDAATRICERLPKKEKSRKLYVYLSGKPYCSPSRKMEPKRVGAICCTTPQGDKTYGIALQEQDIHETCAKTP